MAEAVTDDREAPLSADVDRPERDRWTEPVLAGLASSLILYVLNFATRGWTLSVPRSYESDGAYYLMLAQGIKQNGWYLDNPSLGYPYGQDLRDFPQGLDNLMLCALRLLTIVCSPAVAVNLLFVGGAFVIGAVTCVVMRRLGCEPVVAAVFAVVYATLPAHSVRGVTHVMLSAYWSLPLGGWIALELMSGRSLLHGGRGRAKRLVVLGVVAAVVASSGSYYAVFVMVAISIGAAWAAVRARAVRPLVEAAAFGAAVAVVAAVNLWPTIAYWRRHGTEDQVARRTPAESITGGLRPWEMFDVSAGRTVNPSNLEVAGSYLGAVACVALVVGVVAIVRKRRVAGEAGHAVVLALVCAAIAAPYSLSYVIASAGFAWVREWHRMSMLIAFFALAAAALWVSRASRWRTYLVAGVCLVAAVDAGSTLQRTDVDRARPARWRSDAEFFQGMADALPDGAAVVTLPYQNFPGFYGYGGTDAYDPAKGYVHAPRLRWQFGAIWSRVPGPPPNFGGDVACYARSIDAAAIVMDIVALPPDPGSLHDTLTVQVGHPADISPDGRYAWFDLRAWQGGGC